MTGRAAPPHGEQPAGLSEADGLSALLSVLDRLASTTTGRDILYRRLTDEAGVPPAAVLWERFDRDEAARPGRLLRALVRDRTVANSMNARVRLIGSVARRPPVMAAPPAPEPPAPVVPARRGSAIPVPIGGRDFATKNDARAHFSHMLNRVPDGVALSGQDHLDLMSVLCLHPNAPRKIGCGVHHFYRRRWHDKLLGVDMCSFWLMRTDGSTESLSFQAAIDRYRPNRR